MDALRKKDTGAAKLALELEMGFAPAGREAQASGSLRLSAGATRGFLAAIAFPASIALGGIISPPEIGGPGFEIGWADRLGSIGVEASVDLDLPPPGARLGSKVGAGIVSDPIAAEAWIVSSIPLPLDPKSICRPGFRAGLSLAHALNDIVSTAMAAEIGVSEGVVDPRVGVIFDGGAAVSVSAAYMEWSTSATISLSFPYARSRFSIGYRRVIGRIALARGKRGGA